MFYISRALLAPPPLKKSTMTARSSACSRHLSVEKRPLIVFERWISCCETDEVHGDSEPACPIVGSPHMNLARDRSPVSTCGHVMRRN